MSRQTDRSHEVCPGCGLIKMAVSLYCRACTIRLRAEKMNENLKLVPGACRHCGIRPVPEYDMVDRLFGRYQLVIHDEICDDCRLRLRRDRQYDEGLPSRQRTHTPVLLT